MKLCLRGCIATAFAAGVFGSFSGCSKEERVEAGAKAREIVAESKAALNRGWETVKTATFDKRADVEAHAKAMAAEMEAQASRLRANYSDAKASASRRAAMEELRNAEADYRQKLASLANATADTWDSAKQHMIAAWDRLQAAYRKALVE